MRKKHRIMRSITVDNQTVQYQYFMLKVTAVQSGNTIQLSELIMDGIACEHSSSDEGKVTEPTCTEAGYTMYRCTICGLDYKDNIQSAIGHNFGDDDLCTVCGKKRVGSFALHNACAFKIEDNSTQNVTIILADDTENILKSGTNCAGLQKNGSGDGIGKLTIQAEESGTGSLTAIGGNGGAGIGGGYDDNGSEIIISGGSIMAVAGYSGNDIVQHSETDETVITGSWSWKDTSTKPVVAGSNATQYDVVFNPTDTDNYNTVETKITLTVNKLETTPNIPESTMSAMFSQKTVEAVGLPEILIVKHVEQRLRLVRQFQ